MKYIKRIRLFENSQDLTEDQIDFLDQYSRGKWEVNPNTGLVDVKGDFVCWAKALSGFSGVKFGEVDGSFYCSKNKLTSLEGSPYKIGGDFDCSNSALSSLKGAPKEVRGSFFCHKNELTSLEGSPNKVGDDFEGSYNLLTSLEGAPENVGGYFLVTHNKLSCLKGAPQNVKSFHCSHNLLTSLEGSPQEVGGDFYCYKNLLTSLEGAPKKVRLDFVCNDNNITSLKGAPVEIGNGFYCDSFKIPDNLMSDEKWGLKGWLGVMKRGTPEGKILILTLPQFDPTRLIQDEIDKNPGKWVMILKDIWNSDGFRPIRDQLKVSDQFLKDIGDQSGLSDLGF